MRKIILLLIMVVPLVVGCAWLRAKPSTYKLDVKCTCPDGDTAKPVVKVPEILVADYDG
jgi:uncharacterized lipoprotein YmbA